MIVSDRMLVAVAAVLSALVLAACSQAPSASTSTSGLLSTTTAPASTTTTTRPHPQPPLVSWTNVTGAGGNFWLVGTYRCGKLTCIAVAKSTNGGGSFFVRVAAPPDRVCEQQALARLGGGPVGSRSILAVG